MERVRFNLLKTSVGDKLARAVLQPLINLSVGWLDWYERRLCRLWPVDDIHWLLRPVKAISAGQPASARGQVA